MPAIDHWRHGVVRADLDELNYQRPSPQTVFTRISVQLGDLTVERVPFGWNLQAAVLL